MPFAAIVRLDEPILESRRAKRVDRAVAEVAGTFILRFRARVTGEISCDLRNIAVSMSRNQAPVMRPPIALEEREQAVVVNEVFALAIKIDVGLFGNHAAIVSSVAGRLRPGVHSRINCRLACLRLREFWKIRRATGSPVSG